MLFNLWIISLFALIIPTSIYIIFINYIADKYDWNIELNPNYEPTLTIIISTYNEEKVIEKRLENIIDVDYPKSKIEVIHVDSASTDNTVSLAKKFAIEHPDVNINIIEEQIREGKGKALNHALQYAINEIVVTSDADSFFAHDALRNIVKYLANPKVAAVTGRGIRLNPDQSLLTKIESNYLNIYHKIKLGESKLDSTVIFVGELSAYKKSHLTKFEDSKGGDDCSTALYLVQKGFRTLFAHDATFFDAMPSTLKDVSTIEIRRAQHQVLLWVECLKLLFKRKLKLNYWIALGEIIFHLINPILFLIFAVLTIMTLLYYPIFTVAIVPLFLLRKVRIIIIGYIKGNIILLIAIVKVMSGDKQIIWGKVDAARRWESR